MPDDLLDALGWKENFKNHVLLFTLCVVVTALFAIVLSVAQYVHLVSIREIIILHLIAWSVWFVWLGYIFPKRRKRLLMNYNQSITYKKAFYSQVLPGITFLVALMTRPFSYALFAPSFEGLSYEWYIPGIVCTVSAFFIMFNALKAIGTARAAFVFEYNVDDKPLSNWGIYGYIRHPLVLGIALGSLGITLFFENTIALILAIINFAMLPIYALIEDRRLTEIFGDQFSSYRSSVGRFFPKPVVLKTFLAKRKGKPFP